MPLKGLSDSARRMVPLLAAAGIMGFGAVVLLQQYLHTQLRALQRREQQLMANYREPVDVVVAAKDLEAGTTLESSSLAMAKVPERFLQPYSSRSPAELVGLVTVAPIAAGEQVLANKLRRFNEAPTEGSTLSALTPKGKRAVTIGVGAITGVGGFVRPGDSVDVLWTFKLPAQPGQAQGEGQAVTMTLFQDVPVLAVGREMLGRSSPVAESSPDYTVTLALTPQETSFLLFAREQGSVQLSLRSQLENRGAQAISPANINTLLQSQLGLKIPSASPTSGMPQRTAEVCKGLECKRVVLSGTPDESLVSFP